MVQPVGSEAPVCVDVRVIAATNRNLREEVARGRFREDLYYRLRVLPIRIPPLRERPADIEPLAALFAGRYAGPGGKLSERAMAKLSFHSWPGNVRELQNVIQRAVIHSGGGTIHSEHIDLEPALCKKDDDPSLPLSLEAAERQTIGNALARTRGNRTEAAAALGISPRTLRHKLKQYRDAGMPLVEAAG
jgi:two-component system response regulator FlrC